jgi:hypothetical protein
MSKLSGPAVSTIDTHDGLALFIGMDAGNKPSIEVVSLPGDEASLEEATKKLRKRSKLWIGMLAVIWVLIVVADWVSLFSV